MTMPFVLGHRLAFLASAALLVACGRAGLDPLPGQGGDAQGGTGQGASGEGGSGAGQNGGGDQGGGLPSGGGVNVGGFGGGTTQCVLAQECEDFDPCTSNICPKGGECVFPLRDDDGDGQVAASCGGLDCDDTNPNVFAGNLEDCTDGADNDCNSVADCFDPQCDGQECGCEPEPEDCDNDIDDDCDGFVDCFDTQCAGTPACGCLPSESGFCQNGFDEDCDGEIDCDDSDCSALPACQCQSNDEACFGGQDDDCDLLIDCADPDCQGVFPCACQPPGVPEQCSDDIDNDCDTLPDCADPDCFTSPACQDCEPEICDDGLDNDCDLQIDCADDACLFTPGCQPVPEICNNDLDDDGDGDIDCADPDCAITPICQLEQANCLSPKFISGSGTHTGDTTGHTNETEGTCGGKAGEAVFFFTLTEPSFVHIDSSGSTFDSTLYLRTGVCNTGLELGCDDDSAGSLAANLDFTILYPGTYFVFLDGFTVDVNGGPNEGPFTMNIEIIPNPPEICGDGLDNDGDIYIDCADPDCTDQGACFLCNGGLPPEPEFAPGLCTDGQDNDCDGTIDCGDEDCSASDVYVTECCNGIDDTGNGVIDEFNCRCANDGECQGSQICYDHTVHACGIPCDNFFGDVCPFIRPGSTCSPVTQQCEFL